MMTIDQVTIEEYLDGELPEPALREFERLVANNASAQALIADVRRQRHERELVWKSYEPSEAQTARLVEAFIRKAHAGENTLRDDAVAGRIISPRITYWLKRSLAVAACLAIGVGGYAIGRRSGSPAATPAAAAGYTVRVQLPNGETVSQSFHSYNSAKNFERYARQYIQETQSKPAAGSSSPVSLAQQGEF